MKERKWKIRGGKNFVSIVSRWKELHEKNTYFSGSSTGSYYGCTGSNLKEMTTHRPTIKDYPEISYKELEEYLFSPHIPTTYSLWL